MTREELAALTKSDLLERARTIDVRGRSTMNKSQLVEALFGAGQAAEVTERVDTLPRIPIPGVSSEDRVEAQERRTGMYDRLAALVDQEHRCRWRSIEGHVCGLPVVRDDDACILHTGRGRYDTAVPVTGRLGFDTWPTLLRHLHLATYDVDPIGLDPIIHEMAWHVLNGLYYDYFRVDVEGIENVPMAGAAMIVANHGGAAI
ncbi:MAG TPA: hypothetical protein VFD97_00750, partial [Acidimicrobiia bacterium]|nr:hypothetical protein [Acidimicrobiia bacterium]